MPGLSDSLFPSWEMEIRKLLALEACWEEVLAEMAKRDARRRIRDP